MIGAGARRGDPRKPPEAVYPGKPSNLDSAPFRFICTGTRLRKSPVRRSENRSCRRPIELSEPQPLIRLEATRSKFGDELLRGQEALRLTRKLREDERLSGQRLGCLRKSVT